MNQALVNQITHALLYEGYILYPYRPSLKNRQRWTFGGLYPPGTGSATMQTEVLVHGERPLLEVRVRFLQLMARRIGEIVEPVTRSPGKPRVRFVEALQIADQQFLSWQEAVERDVVVAPRALAKLIGQPLEQKFAFPSNHQQEPIHGPKGELAGVIVREQRAVNGQICMAAERVESKLFRVSIKVTNQTAFTDSGSSSHDEAALHSLASTHALLGVREGAFISLLDPPEQYHEPAQQCRNVGVWPVLVGEEGQRDTMLASPIILYDYPQIANESPGDFFDGTEIDEMLALRILTLTDEEKRTMAAVDRRAGDLLNRTEALAREQLITLHGARRDVRPTAETPTHG
jgi:hydrogenase maturation protease